MRRGCRAGSSWRCSRDCRSPDVAAWISHSLEFFKRLRGIQRGGRSLPSRKASHSRTSPSERSIPSRRRSTRSSLVSRSRPSGAPLEVLTERRTARIPTMKVSTELITEAKPAISAATRMSLSAPSALKIDEPDPPIPVKRKPHGPEGISKVPVKRRRRHRHRRSAEHESGARFTGFAREAEQDDVGRRRCPGEHPVAVHLVLQPAIDEGPFPVVSVADRAKLHPEMLGHDPGADLIQGVMPRQGSEMSARSVPPEDSHVVEPEQSCSCPLKACKVQLEHLIGGQNPMLVQVDTDELISFRSG
jgi:hypothetical protein